MIDLKYPSREFGVLDLSTTNRALESVDVSSSDRLHDFIESVKKDQGVEILIGGYLERRSIYDRSIHFAEEADRRNIHLGVDIWAPAEMSVLAIRAGVVHSKQDNVGYGNYGPTIILRHTVHDRDFFSLYGHLSRESLSSIEVGSTVSKGDVIGHLGTAKVNGDYPPHLHLQVIHDLQEWSGDYPGVCSASELPFYIKNCPDPSLYLW